MSDSGPAPAPKDKDSLRLVRAPARRDEEEIEKRPLSFGLIVRLAKFARPHLGLVLVLLALVVTRSVQLPMITWAVQRVIAGAINAGDFDGVVAGTIVFLAIALSTDFTFHFRSRLALVLGEAVMYDLRGALVEHIHRQPMSFFTKTSLGRLIARITSDVESVRGGIQDVLFISMVQLGQMIVAGIMMFSEDRLLFSVVLGLAPVVWLVNHYYRRYMSIAAREVQESFSRVTSTIAESVNGIRVTQGFARQEVNARLFSKLVEDHGRYNMNVARVGSTLSPLLDFNSQLTIAVLLMVGGWRALTSGDAGALAHLITFYLLAGMFFGPILVVANQYSHALTAMAGAERVFRLLDTAPEWRDDPGATPIGPIEGRVEFKSLWFAYEPGRPVLHDVSFEIEPGQTVALVGHTGCGKSTIVNLISKFYLPTAGQYLIDGREIHGITSDSLHRQMGIVLQVNFLFTGTIMENIRIGRPDASDAEVMDAARRLGTLEAIAAMPEGFATDVGERGCRLSLGQRQLVCFTRAMLADPRIMLLDEATSSLDSLTEDHIQRALAVLLRGRTSIVVAHRLSTIRHADAVLVLDQGRIVERGTHDSLLAAGGIYAELHHMFSEK